MCSMENTCWRRSQKWVCELAIGLYQSSSLSASSTILHQSPSVSNSLPQSLPVSLSLYLCWSPCHTSAHHIAACSSSWLAEIWSTTTTFLTGCGTPLLSRQSVFMCWLGRDTKWLSPGRTHCGHFVTTCSG